MGERDADRQIARGERRRSASVVGHEGNARALLLPATDELDDIVSVNDRYLSAPAESFRRLHGAAAEQRNADPVAAASLHEIFRARSEPRAEGENTQWFAFTITAEQQAIISQLRRMNC